MRHRIIDTFTGPFAIIEHDDGHLSTAWLSPEIEATLAGSHRTRMLQPDLVNRLNGYFAGEDVDFSDIELPRGERDNFYHRCWNACREIPRGGTISYAELAVNAGSTATAARAAGQAMRNNPLPIVVPCHRVIGSTGKLHGFSGTCDAASSEVGVKSALLQMEGAEINAFAHH